MIRYKGTNIVKVLKKENTNPVVGGEMVCTCGYLGVIDHSTIFYFVEPTTFVGGEIRNIEFSVTNVSKPGLYKKNTLIGY